MNQQEIFSADSAHEECGVFGIYDASKSIDVARYTYYGLYALQHRGQESCGIAVNSIDEFDNIKMLQYKDLGLNIDIFPIDYVPENRAREYYDKTQVLVNGLHDCLTDIAFVHEKK